MPPGTRRHDGAVPRRRGVLLGLALAVVTLVGCGPAHDGAAPPSAAPLPTVSVAPGTTGVVALGKRPFRLHVPAGDDGTAPLPLVVALHGYTSNSEDLDRYLGLTPASDARGFLLALPDGTLDSRGDEFWNAAPSCCDFDGSRVDDSGYLSDLIAAVRAAHPVDRVAVVGHSNGGYMAHRLACDHADQVDAIASLAGPLPADTSGCRPSRPVSVLHIHGTADTTVPYRARAGDSSAPATAAAWAALDGCRPTATAAPAQDDDSSIAGAETTVQVWSDGCRDDSRVELWSIQGGPHTPQLTSAFTGQVLDFLLGR